MYVITTIVVVVIVVIVAAVAMVVFVVRIGNLSKRDGNATTTAKTTWLNKLL